MIKLLLGVDQNIPGNSSRPLLLFSVVVQADNPIDYVESHGGEFAATAGACNTFAIFNYKQCAVIGALDHSVAAIQKPVLLPVQGCIQVRTAIAIDKYLAVFFYGKEIFLTALKTKAAPLGNIAGQ